MAEEKHELFPYLGKGYLVIAALSTPSERMFSASGYISLQ